MGRRILDSWAGRRRPTDDVSLGESRQRMAVLAGLGLLLGVVGGIAAFALVRLVGIVSNLALLHRWGVDLPNLAHYHPSPVLIPVAVGGALVVALVAHWAPVVRGHGIPESLEAVVLRESRIRPRVLVAKPLTAAIAIGTGGPFGAEGPIVVTGGTVGSLLGQVLPVSAAERRILLATGAAAGMAGVFATPVAAIVLAFELLLFERSLRSLLPLLLATGVATELHLLLLGSHPVFAVAHDPVVPPVQVPLLAGVGLLAGLLAVVLDRGLFAVEAGFRRLPLPDAVHPLVGAVGFASVGLLVPGTLSVGYWAIGDAVNGRFVLTAAAALCVAKLVSWWVALASGTSGGTLAPMFLIGATMGEVVGSALAHLWPASHLDPGAFAIVAMGATFGVAARAPLTGAVFALEATGAYHLVVPMLLAVGLAEVVGEQLLSERIMTEKLFRRGYRVEFDTEVDPFRTAVAGQVMEPLPPAGPAPGTPSVDRQAYLREALALFLAGDAQEVVVTEAGRAVGMLRRSVVADVLARRIAESSPQPATLRLRWRKPNLPPADQ